MRDRIKRAVSLWLPYIALAMALGQQFLAKTPFIVIVVSILIFLIFVLPVMLLVNWSFKWRLFAAICFAVISVIYGYTAWPPPPKIPALQIDIENFRFFPRNNSNVAGYYQAFLENRGTESVQLAQVLMGVTLTETSEPLYEDWLVTDYILSPGKDKRIDASIEWSTIDEILAKHNSNSCCFMLIIKAYNEKGDIIEARRKIGSIKDGESRPFVQNRHTLFK